MVTYSEFAHAAKQQRDEEQERYRVSLMTIRANAAEQAMGMTKWLLAALLALNGGALLAMLNGEWMPADGLIVSAIIFTCGILCTILCGALLMHSGRGVVGEMDALGFASEISFVDLMSASDDAVRLSKSALCAGYGALFLFVAGMFAAGWSVHEGARLKAASEATARNAAQSNPTGGDFVGAERRLGSQELPLHSQPTAGAK